MPNAPYNTLLSVITYDYKLPGLLKIPKSTRKPYILVYLPYPVMSLGVGPVSIYG
jgi:hypothetical protein